MIKGLPKEWTNSDLQDCFGKFGSIVTSTVVRKCCKSCSCQDLDFNAQFHSSELCCRDLLKLPNIDPLLLKTSNFEENTEDINYFRSVRLVEKILPTCREKTIHELSAPYFLENSSLVLSRVRTHFIYDSRFN